MLTRCEIKTRDALLKAIRSFEDELQKSASWAQMKLCRLPNLKHQWLPTAFLHRLFEDKWYGKDLLNFENGLALQNVNNEMARRNFKIVNISDSKKSKRIILDLQRLVAVGTPVANPEDVLAMLEADMHLLSIDDQTSLKESFKDLPNF